LFAIYQFVGTFFLFMLAKGAVNQDEYTLAWVILQVVMVSGVGMYKLYRPVPSAGSYTFVSSADTLDEEAVTTG
jgi:hypothetical protein